MTKISWQVGAMTPTDLPAVYQIELQSPSPWNLRQLTEELAHPDGLQLVCCLKGGDTVSGFLMARLQTTEVEILKIATAREFQRQGTASILLQTLIALADLRGIQHIHLELRSENLPARTLYEKNGFEVTGQRSNYYTGPKDNALCMTLSLPRREYPQQP